MKITRGRSLYNRNVYFCEMGPDELNRSDRSILQECDGGGEYGAPFGGVVKRNDNGIYEVHVYID